MTTDEIAEKLWDDNASFLTDLYGDLDKPHPAQVFGYAVDYQVTFRGVVGFALLHADGLLHLHKLPGVANDATGRVLLLPNTSPLKELVLPPSTKFTTIVADPPWKYGNQAAKGAVGDKYEPMDLDQIVGMPVESLAADKAHLYLWTTNHFLLEGHAATVARAWGFEPKTVITWLKTGRMGVGNYFRGDTEHILFATRGNMPTNKPQNVRNWFLSEFHEEGEVFQAPWVGHSRKPDISYNVIAQKSPGKYLELFARAEPMESSKEWTRWGKEAIGKTEIPELTAYFKSQNAAA